MNIGIIVYSRTGHTLSVAAKLKEKLSAAGHAATLEQVETAGPVSLSATSAVLKTTPATDPYDGLALCSSVQGGLLAPPMRSYLDQVPSLAGKRVVCLVTGFFPAEWGRNQTVAQLQAICESKGATVCGSGSVGWFSLRRRRQISQVVDSLSEAF